ncbi:MAG: hypothetical protein JWP46_2839 [Modestobacter sp.]|nr:hypothetical protein [Modestobacter sp.]
MDAGMVLLFVVVLLGAGVGGWLGERLRRQRRERWPDG